MARFSKIPESNVAGTLGGLVGTAAGTVVGNATITLSKVEDRLNALCLSNLNVTTVTEDSRQKKLNELNRIEHTLDVVEQTLNGVEKQTSVLNTTVNTVKVPIVALKTAITVLKALPLPQMYLVTSVSALQADALQMLSELVAQIEQLVMTLTVAVQIILDLLKKVQDIIKKLRRTIATLKASLVFESRPENDQDVEILESVGILDGTGQSTGILARLGMNILSNGSDIIWLGNLSQIDTGSLTVQNQVKAAESGTVIKIPTTVVGNWITCVYKHSKNRPATPAGSSLEPETWTLTEPLDSNEEWYSKGTVSGMSGKVLHWSEPELYVSKPLKNPGKKATIVEPGTQPVHVYRMDQTKIELTKFDLKETHAIVLQNGNEGYGLMYELLTLLDQSTLSQDLKNSLIETLNGFELEETVSQEYGTEYYRSLAGDLYTLRLKTSTRSPKIATLRYVEVTDESGTIVYEGTETFATNPAILFEETKVRLNQLFG